MGKAYKQIIIFIIILLLTIITIGQRGKIIKLENEQKVEIQLEICPLCDSNNISINPVNDSFYIKCKKCDLQTDYFASKNNLIEYWNNRK